MKKMLFLLVLMVLLLCGCGGGGSDSPAAFGDASNNGIVVDGTDTDAVGDNTPAPPTGNVAVYFAPKATAQALRPTGGADFPTQPNMARLVIKKMGQETQQKLTGFQPVVDENGDPVLDEEGEQVTAPVYQNVIVDVVLYQGVFDGEIPGYVTASVLPGNGYTLEVVTYEVGAPAFDESTKYMHEYTGPIPFDLVSGETTEISLTGDDALKPLEATLGFPAPYDPSTFNTGIISGQNYNLSVMRSEIMKRVLRDECFYQNAVVAFTVDVEGSQVPAVVDYVPPADRIHRDTYSFTAPPDYAGTNPEDTSGTWWLQFQGQHFITDGLLKKGEKWQDWVFNARSEFPLTPLGAVRIAQ